MGSEDLRRRIEATKSKANDKYAICRVAARKLASAHRDMAEAEERRDAKNNSRSAAAHAVAENAFKSAMREYASFVSLYDSLVTEVLDLYDALIAEEGARVAKRIQAEAEKFENQQSFQRARLQELVDGISGIEAAIGEAKQANKATRRPSYNREEPAIQREEPQHESYNIPKTQPVYTQPQSTPYGAPYYPPMQQDYYRPYPPQGYSIAPASIDISAIVEDAVASAMEKFKAAFDKRADAFIENMPEQEAPSEQGDSPELAVALCNEIAESEATVIEKLTALMEKMKGLTAELTELGAAYLELSNVKTDAVEAERRINDMQRSLAREIQGVQAKQKVLNQDQAALSAEQTVLAEEQRASLENHKLLLGGVAEISDMQKTVKEAQDAIDSSMRELLTSQKSMISTHQSIIAANAKAAELSREITERQAELTAIQKNAMAEHKHLARKYKPREKRSNEAALDEAEEN